MRGAHRRPRGASHPRARRAAASCPHAPASQRIRRRQPIRQQLASATATYRLPRYKLPRSRFFGVLVAVCGAQRSFWHARRFLAPKQGHSGHPRSAKPRTPGKSPKKPNKFFSHPQHVSHWYLANPGAILSHNCHTRITNPKLQMRNYVVRFRSDSHTPARLGNQRKCSACGFAQPLARPSPSRRSASPALSPYPPCPPIRSSTPPTKPRRRPPPPAPWTPTTRSPSPSASPMPSNATSA